MIGNAKAVAAPLGTLGGYGISAAGGSAAKIAG